MNTIDDLLAWLAAMPPIDRARVAGLLVDHDTTKAVGAVRRGAIYEETRVRSYADVAADLGVSLSAINKAISEHRRSRPDVPDEGAR